MKRTSSMCLVLAIVLAIAAIEVLPSWEVLDSAPVSGGYGEAVVETDKCIFLVKCLYATSRPEVHCYSAESGTWDAATDKGLPDGAFRSGTALAWDGAGSIYCLGGARCSDSTRRVFLRYQVDGDTWEVLADTPFAQGAGDALAWSGYDSALYALVGSPKHNGGRSAFISYSPEAGTWTELQTPWPTTDDGASLVWAGNEYLYALRGEYDESTPNGEFARYDLADKEWEFLAALPDAGGVGDGGSLLWIGQWEESHAGYIYCLSGGTVSEEPGYGFYRYSIASGEWDQLSDIPCPIGYYVGNRLAYANGYLYYWQGSPRSEKWICKGDAFCRYQASSFIPDPCEQCLARLNAATESQFDECPDIGDTLKGRLVQEKPYRAIPCSRAAIEEDLQRVDQIGPKRSRFIVDCICKGLFE